jgi:phospholipid-binding lipoprotein MlaA
MRLRKHFLLTATALAFAWLAFAWAASPAWAEDAIETASTSIEQPDATAVEAAPAAEQSGAPASAAPAQTQPAADSGKQTAAEGAAEDANDPLEGMNRAIFHASLVTDHVVIKPVALGYRAVVPRPVRKSIRNFLNNLDSPPIFANELLQGDFDGAGTTVLRFGINSTIGVGGLFEVAEGWGLPRHTEDFGQTLGTYGMGEGPYLFLPLAGPAPPRDLAGRVVDIFLDPLTYVHMGSQNYWRYVRVGTDAIDLRERNIETLDEIERTSVDYYASIRSLYRQTRNNEIRNGQPDTENLPDF